MKANLPKLEPDMIERWDAMDIYGRIRQASGERPLWILHDGPPYANGHIHMGHLLNKILKDFIVKSRSMLGHNAVYVPGWDCHGLPIEHQVDKELGLDTASLDVRRAMDPLEKIGRCREYAPASSNIQREEFKRLGVFGDWKHPYMTMDPAYQATIVREFGRFVRPRHRLQGPRSRCTGACTARRPWPRPRWSTRTRPRRPSTCAFR